MAQDDGALFNVWVLAKTGFEPGVAREICADCDENCSNKGLLVTLSRSCVCVRPLWGLDNPFCSA